MCYLVGGFVALWLHSPKKIMIGMVALIAAHWAILWNLGGYEPYSLKENISGPIDVMLVGVNHVYRDLEFLLIPKVFSAYCPVLSLCFWAT